MEFAVAGTWPWAVLFYAALAVYVLLDKASWRMRAPLLAGLVVVAAWMLPFVGPTEDFGFMSYGPSDQRDLMLQQMAQRTLALTTWTGLTLLAAYGCLGAAVWALPRKRNVPLAIVAGLMAVGALAIAIPTLSDVYTQPVVWIVGLGLLAGLAIALVAGQRAGLAWLAVIGAVPLVYQSLDLLEGAVLNATLAQRKPDGFLNLGMTTLVQAPDLEERLLPILIPAGLLLVVLACRLPARREPAPAEVGLGE